MRVRGDNAPSNAFSLEEQPNKPGVALVRFYENAEPFEEKRDEALKNAGLDGVKLSLLDAMGMDILSGLMGVVLAVVGASLCGGGGVAMVSAGPAGMVAGAAAGILLALVGKSGMEKALVKAKLPLLVRRLVTDKAVKSGLSRQRDEIEKAIIKALADPANGFSARLCQSLSQTLGAQMERMAKDAEMSICA